MPEKKLTTYEGTNRDVVFVEKTEKNPAFDGKRDARKYRVSAQWQYLCRRHNHFWNVEMGEKKRRAVPQHYHDGEKTGWWFPKAWVADFIRSPQPYREPPLPPAGPKMDSGGSFPKQDELKSWRLPAGSIISASDATVQYPDGTVETWGEIRRSLRPDRAEAA